MINNRRQFCLTITLILVFAFLLTSLASYFVSRSALRENIDISTLPLTSDTIYSEIQQDLIQPVFISSLMSSNTFLRDWILSGEKDETQIRKFLNEIHTRYNTVASFLVSDKTYTYYHFLGILKQVDPADTRDAWYFRVKGIHGNYETNVDPDMANKDTMTIFVNHKVFDYEGTFIGAAGIGLEVTSVKETIEKYQQKYNRHIYFSDTKGTIVLRGKNSHSTATKLQEMEGLSTIAATLLAAEQTSATFKRGNALVHINSRFIPELDWFLMVEEAEDASTREIFKTLILNLIFCAVIIILVLFFLNSTAKSYAKRLEMLAREDDKLRSINSSQELEISAQNDELLKKNSSLVEALAEVKQLSGFLPICASCKKIRDDKGYWNQIEAYISKHSEAEFSHSMCPTCAKEFYPEYYDSEDESVSLQETPGKDET
jgi:hypothetical protein